MAFDPKEPRNKDGKWTSAASGHNAGGGNRGIAKAIVDVHAFHGSPFASIQEFKGKQSFFTKNEKVAEQYAKNNLLASQRGHAGAKNPTVYGVKVDVGSVFDMRNKFHQEIYDKIRSDYNKATNDPDAKLPKITSEGFIQSDGLPSFGHSSTIIDQLGKHGFHTMLVSEGSQGTSILVSDPAKRVKIVSKRQA